MPLATVIDFRETRRIETVMDGDHVTALVPVPNSLRCSLLLGFDDGNTIELVVSSEDFGRITAASQAALKQKPPEEIVQLPFDEEDAWLAGIGPDPRKHY